MCSILGVNGYDERCILFTEQYYKIILCGTPFYMFASAMASIIIDILEDYISKRIK